MFRLEVRYEGLVFFASVNGDPLFAFNSGSGQLNMQFTEAEVTGALEASFFGFLPPGATMLTSLLSNTLYSLQGT